MRRRTDTGNRSGIRPEDVELFRRLAGEVVPLRQNRAEPPRPRRVRPPANDPPPRPAFPFQDAPVEEAMRVSSEAVLEYRGPGLQDRVYRRLRRGQIRPERDLDLHGLTVERAGPALERFMAEGGGPRRCCVRVIHGKGYRSSGGRPVIKQKVQAWLRCHPRVLAYCSCAPADGGAGALYVLLRGAPAAPGDYNNN